MQFTITSEYHKMRLDKFLKEHFPDLSRSYLQKFIEDGRVKVNGKKVTVHHFLKAGDAVEAIIEPPQEIVMVANPEVQIIPSPPPSPLTPTLSHGERGIEVGRGGLRMFPLPAVLRGEDDRPPRRDESRLGRSGEGNIVWIIHEEPDFLVLNKPAGLVVHQGEGHKAPNTLANGLVAKYPEVAKVGDDPVRPGMMHRLDADVSGVMVIARTQDMFDYLKKQFKVHEVEKEYVAVVEGEVFPPEGTIEFALARKGVKMVARPKTPSGSRLSKGEKRAVTEYEAIGTAPRGLATSAGTILRVITHTGRTHQIRVHLKAKGWPIVGDRLYGKEPRAKSKEQSKTLYALCPMPYAAASRLMLHARRIAFKDLTGKRREFIVEPDFM